MSKKVIDQVNAHNDKLSLLSSIDRFNRARSITVGTSFNGTIEISMRTDGKYLWAVFQPVEVIELIHQLAASVGCHIHIQPRKDFSSWRKWNEEERDNNFPPFSNFPPFGEEPKFSNQVPNLAEQTALIAKDDQNETMAIEKPKNRRSIKRAAKAA